MLLLIGPNRYHERLANSSRSGILGKFIRTARTESWSIGRRSLFVYLDVFIALMLIAQGRESSCSYPTDEHKIGDHLGHLGY